MPAMKVDCSAQDRSGSGSRVTSAGLPAGTSALALAAAGCRARAGLFAAAGQRRAAAAINVGAGGLAIDLAGIRASGEIGDGAGGNAGAAARGADEVVGRETIGPAADRGAAGVAAAPRPSRGLSSNIARS